MSSPGSTASLLTSVLVALVPACTDGEEAECTPHSQDEPTASTSGFDPDQVAIDLCPDEQEAFCRWFTETTGEVGSDEVEACVLYTLGDDVECRNSIARFEACAVALTGAPDEWPEACASLNCQDG
jgi:hypothetical protein